MATIRDFLKHNYITSLKFKIGPWNGTILRGKLSSNHHFSGGMGCNLPHKDGHFPQHQSDKKAPARYVQRLCDHVACGGWYSESEVSRMTRKPDLLTKCTKKQCCRSSFSGSLIYDPRPLARWSLHPNDSLNLADQNWSCRLLPIPKKRISSLPFKGKSMILFILFFWRFLSLIHIYSPQFYSTLQHNIK